MIDTILLVVSVMILHVAGPISAVHAVLYSHSSQGAIAWAIALTTFPYLALPAYWMFGRNRFHEYRQARQEGDRELIRIADRLVDSMKPFSISASDVPELLTAEKLARLPIQNSNDVSLLIDGDITFDSILDGIDTAKQYLLIQFYIINNDHLGLQLQKRLIARAKAGVKVYFLYDRIGSQHLGKKFLKEMREAGISCFDFNARKGPSNRLRINFRNHRKIVVVDGHSAWIGGHNVGDEYLGKGKLGEWRDTHIKCSGPSVMPIQLSFVEDWNWATGSVPDLSWKPVPSKENKMMLIMATGPGDQMETAGLMFVHAINSARKRIWIASPYFVPDDSVVGALQLAGLRGIDVRIIIPDNPDKRMVYLAAFSYLKEASLTGVRFYRYEYGFMHQKAILIDDHISAVGTANMDNRSFRLNFEITGFVISESFNRQVKEMFENDFERSRMMQPNEYEHFTFFFNLKIRLARLFAPLL